MKAGDYILDATITGDRKRNGYCLTLKVHESDTNTISETKIHSNESLLKLDTDLIKLSRISLLAQHQETGKIFITFQTHDGLIAWTCENPSGDFREID